MNMGMKQIKVVAAVIRKGDKIFATQRGYGEWKDWWEFPGGKMEAGETPEGALVREISEELSADISVDQFLCTVEYDYPQFHLTMHCYLCSLLTEALHLNEHEAARWLTKDELDSVKWLPADVKVVEKLRMNDHEGRRARERQRERSGNCSNETNISFHNNKYRLAKKEQRKMGFSLVLCSLIRIFAASKIRMI